jgi:hypothetical protein
MDDVLIFSKTPEEHLVHLTKVLERLHTHKFKVRFDKCFWGRKELEFLGHHLFGSGISPSPSKVKVVSEWERPKDLHELRVFLGFVNFYKKYIPNYSKVARPLNDFTKKGVLYEWTTLCETAFRSLKQALISAPCLVLPNTGPEARFVLATDSSGFAIGSVLLQD